MKKNVYSLLVMIALALTATFTACSDDDDDTPPVEIKLDENIVTLLPGESATVKILEGNGSYQVSSQMMLLLRHQLMNLRLRLPV